MSPTTEPDIMPPAKAGGSAPWTNPPLLRSDDKTEFDRLLASLSATSHRAAP